MYYTTLLSFHFRNTQTGCVRQIHRVWPLSGLRMVQPYLSFKTTRFIMNTVNFWPINRLGTHFGGGYIRRHFEQLWILLNRNKYICIQHGQVEQTAPLNFYFFWNPRRPNFDDHREDAPHFSSKSLTQRPKEFIVIQTCRILDISFLCIFINVNSPVPIVPSGDVWCLNRY